MKKSYLSITLALILITVSNFNIQAQSTSDRLNLPGDNLNLYAVLKIFQESETLEVFEKKLNDEGSRINNLDLNRDGKIDYIKVEDNVDGDVHNIVLQDISGPSEIQDVAVIVVQKKADDQVEIQVIGDEDLYGKNYIIEPNFETDRVLSSSTPNPGFTGGTGKKIVVVKTSTRIISSWPVISFIFRPTYQIWHSPYNWNVYPVYWHPWTPLFWHQYYGWHYHWNYFYLAHYRNWHECRYRYWNNFYFDKRRSRSENFIKIKLRGDFMDCYSRPELIRKGSSEFIKKYPHAPSVNYKLPKVENRSKNAPVKITPHETKPQERRMETKEKSFDSHQKQSSPNRPIDKQKKIIKKNTPKSEEYNKNLSPNRKKGD